MAAPLFPQPKIAFGSRWHKPQDFSDNLHIGSRCMDETGWGCLIYGYASKGRFQIYMEDNKTQLETDKAYYDAICLGLGVYTIQCEHDNPCKRLICNCKIL